uniref:SH2 domain-containing protein n=1 Tax=Caenorhabditis tropicalis TaxID=1561998 RepID=A0A1I7T8K4_9PELO
MFANSNRSLVTRDIAFGSSYCFSVYLPTQAGRVSEGERERESEENASNSQTVRVDSHEDELLAFLKTSHEEPVKQFCHHDIGMCSSVDVSPLPPNDPPKEEEPLNLSDIPDDEL